VARARREAFAPTLVALGCLTLAQTARALDKQGSAHGGEVSASDEFNVSGGLTVGPAIYNPTYAARPDNTGKTLMRYALHADVDLIGQKLSLPIDVNLFSDRERHGLKKLLPTELDVIGGVTTTWPLGPGGVELGTRVEHDRPVDRGSFTQTYVDARARYLYSLADVSPALKNALADGDVSGAVGLGWFAYNPTYAARPDNSDHALLRYILHSELSTFSDLFSLGLDATFFTAREQNAVRPSELDFTPEIILHKGRFELHLAYERDMPLDRSGLVQQFVYSAFVINFDLRADALHPLEKRGYFVSP
jgi:hypothetical protein